MRLRAFILTLLFALCSHGQLTVRNPAYVALLNTRSAAAGGGSCPADGSPSTSQAGVTGWIQVNKDAPYAGQVYQEASNWQICKVAFKLTAIGTISGKTLTAYVYALDGSGDISTGSPLATSDSVTGNNSWSNVDVFFTFPTPPTLTGGVNYAIVVFISGGTDASNYIQTYYNVGGGSIAGYAVAFFGSGASFDAGANDDLAIKIYKITP